MLRTFAIAFLTVIAIVGLSGCTERKEQPSKKSGAPASKSRYVEGDLVLLPAQTAPGQTVYVRYKEPVFAGADTIEVIFGDEPGYVIEVVDPNTLKVLVPTLPAGNVEAAVRTDGRVLGTITFTVEHPPLLRLYFTTSGAELELVSAEPYTGNTNIPPAGGRRLSYDVIDESGEDYLFPVTLFESIELPKDLRQKIALAT